MVPPGSYRFGPDDGRLLLDVLRDGLARRIGHDLLLAVESWSAVATVAESLAASSLTVTADLRSLAVVEGRGGVLPLAERDKKQILSAAAKVLRVDASPELIWASTGIAEDGEKVIAAGDLTLGGRSAPVEVTIQVDGDSATATAAVTQSALGIKPYQAFLGALRVKDVVTVAATVSWPQKTG
jgi:polyisoprenoid-binding protein YceI